MEISKGEIMVCVVAVMVLFVIPVSVAVVVFGALICRCY